MTQSDPTNPSYYKGFSNGAEVIDISENLTGNGAQVIQYVARSTRLDGNNKGDVIENLQKARWFIDRELERLRALYVEARERAIQDSINVAIHRLDVTKIKPFDGPTPEPDEACDCGGD